MKKMALFALCVLLAFTLVGCAKESPAPLQEEESVTEMVPAPTAGPAEGING